MKKIFALITALLLITGVSFSSDSDSEQALLRLKDDMTLAFHEMSDDLSSINLHDSGGKLYHDETVVSMNPELGIKVPGLVGLSFTVGVEYTFKRKLPAGYVYDKP